MPQDKSVISLPSTSKLSVLPNVANNISKVRYNEGIYITDSSVSATYPKSVVRIYKNPNNSKKIYFAAKDTSLLENYIFDLVNNGATKDSDVETYKVGNSYFYSRASESQLFSDNPYEDFAMFSQPYNLDLDSSVVTGKKLNFYKLPQSSQQVVYMSNLNENTDINVNFQQYGLFLKAKSSVTDYQNYDTYKSNKYVSSETATSGERNPSDNALNKLVLYEKFLFDSYAESTNADSDIKNLNPLIESEIQLNKSFTITKLNKIKFSDFVSYKYDNKFVFLNSKSTSGNNEDTFNNKNVKFTTWSNYLTILESTDIAKTDETLSRLNISSYDLYVNSTTSTRSSRDRASSARTSQEKVEKTNDYTPDGTGGGSSTTNSAETFNERLVAIIKPNSSTSTIKDSQLIYIGNNTFSSIRFYSENVNNSGEVTSIDAISDEYQSQFTYETNKIFKLNKELYLDNLFENNLFKDSFNNTENFYSYNRTIPSKNVLTNTYVFNDSFDYSQYGFIPTDFDETIYEFEIDQELDFENGTFVVVEIE